MGASRRRLFATTTPFGAVAPIRTKTRRSSVPSTAASRRRVPLVDSAQRRRPSFASAARAPVVVGVAIRIAASSIPERDDGRGDRPVGCGRVAGIGDPGLAVSALAAEAVGSPLGRPVSPAPEQGAGVHQDGMVATRPVALDNQAMPAFGRDIFPGEARPVRIGHEITNPSPWRTPAVAAGFPRQGAGQSPAPAVKRS